MKLRNLAIGEKTNCSQYVLDRGFEKALRRRFGILIWGFIVQLDSLEGFWSGLKKDHTESVRRKVRRR